MSSRGYFSDGISIDSAALLAIGADRVPSMSSYAVSGITVIDTKDVWQPFTPSLDTPPDTVLAEELTIASDNPADVGVKIALAVMGEGFTPEEPLIVTLDGTNPVAIGSWLRVTRAVVTGTQSLVGTVAVEGASFTYIDVDPEYQRDNAAWYTVDAASDVQIVHLVGSMSGDANAASELSVMIRPYIQDENGDWVGLVPQRYLAFDLYGSGSTSFVVENDSPNQRKGPVDVWFEGRSDKANVRLSATMTLILQDK